MNQELKLIIRQQPQHARHTTSSDKVVDRRPVGPIPILQLEMDIPEKKGQRASSEPFYFLYCSLVDPKTGREVTSAGNGLNRAISGTSVASLARLKDKESSSLKSFFIFNDLLVWIDGVFKLRFSLFEDSSNGIVKKAHIDTDEFKVHSPRDYPGPGESSDLEKYFQLQGCKIRLKKDYYGKGKPKSNNANDDGEQQHVSKKKKGGIPHQLDTKRPTRNDNSGHPASASSAENVPIKYQRTSISSNGSQSDELQRSWNNDAGDRFAYSHHAPSDPRSYQTHFQNSSYITAPEIYHPASNTSRRSSSYSPTATAATTYRPTTTFEYRHTSYVTAPAAPSTGEYRPAPRPSIGSHGEHVYRRVVAPPPRLEAPIRYRGNMEDDRFEATYSPTSSRQTYSPLIAHANERDIHYYRPSSQVYPYSKPKTQLPQLHTVPHPGRPTSQAVLPSPPPTSLPPNSKTAHTIFLNPPKRKYETGSHSPEPGWGGEDHFKRDRRNSSSPTSTN